MIEARFKEKFPKSYLKELFKQGVMEGFIGINTKSHEIWICDEESDCYSCPMSPICTFLSTDGRESTKDYKNYLKNVNILREYFKEVVKEMKWNFCIGSLEQSLKGGYEVTWGNFIKHSKKRS